MVDTLADWMLRFPALFHAIAVVGRFSYWAVLIVGSLCFAFMRGKSFTELWPANSAGGWCWRLGWIVCTALMLNASVLPRPADPPLWFFVLFGIFYCLFGYALWSGIHYLKATRQEKQSPPE